MHASEVCWCTIKMKYVALLSGGKDSCYNVIKCKQYGHELVCLANLCPPSSFSGEEMNSFMYQSAAHTIIPLMEECFGVPLLRREIIGSAVRQELDYVVNENDEVEDLYNLLSDVKTRFPDVAGVSCGAIVSTYQRFRVESVCSRLGMTPLTYLWQRDRAELLNEMVDTGLEAILVKVAGAGLEPYKHLGKTLRELRPTFFRLNAKFGLDVCGEGGEFESLVLDCSVFKKKIVIDASEVVLDDEDCMVGNLKIVSARCVDKDLTEGSSASDLYLSMSDIVQHVQDGTNEQTRSSSVAPTAITIPIGYVSLPAVTMSSSGLGQTGLLFPTPSSADNLRAVVQYQLETIFESLRAALLSLGVQLADILFVHLYIADISFFGPVNEEYCKWFGMYPPSRSCIAVLLAAGVGVAMDAVFLKSSHAAVCRGLASIRQVLHVQSVSEWAPLCIGPYSQANTALDSLIFTAGQIALDPSTMTVLQGPPGGSQTDLLWAQLTLACRHVSRVLQTLNSSLQRVLCCTVFVNESALNDTSRYYWDNWPGWGKVESVVQRLIESNFEPTNVSSVDGDENSDAESVDSAVVVPDRRVPILVVGVPGLPRDALVEVEMISFKDNAIPSDRFAYHEERSKDQQGGELATTAEVVQSWPFWQCNIPFAEAQSVPSVSHVSYTAESHVIAFHRNLCIGFVEVSTVCTIKDRSYPAAIDMDQVAILLVQGLLGLSVKCDLSLNHALLTLRLYYVPGIDAGEVSSLLVKHLAVQCGVIKRLPVLMIPVVSLKPDCVVAAQVVAVDAHQLQSELWIHSK